MIARVMLLIAAGLAFVVVAGLPARNLAGDHQFILCLTAVLLCLVPSVLTMIWVHWTMQHDPKQGPLMALGASGVRMFFVLGVAVILYFQVPLFIEQDAFLFWVLVAYLYLLAIEIFLVVRGAHVAATDPTRKAQ